MWWPGQGAMFGKEDLGKGENCQKFRFSEHLLKPGGEMNGEGNGVASSAKKGLLRLFSREGTFKGTSKGLK